MKEEEKIFQKENEVKSLEKNNNNYINNYNSNNNYNNNNDNYNENDDLFEVIKLEEDNKQKKKKNKEIKNSDSLEVKINKSNNNNKENQNQNFNEENYKLKEENTRELIESNKIEETDLDAKADKIPMTLLEETLVKVGYGKYQIISIFISFICICAYGINITIFASMVLPIKKYFYLNDFELSFMSSLLYIGTAMGHLVTGFITKKFTRRDTVIFLLGIITLLSFLIGLIKNKELFGLFRLFIGLAAGTLLPLIVNTLTEFLPIQMKGFYLMMAFSGVYIGQLIPNLLMIEFIPNLDDKNVGIVFMISSIVPLISLILAFFLFEDSPISLIIKNRTAKALALINKMDKGNHYTIEKQKMLINEMRNKFCIEEKERNLSCLFEEKYKKSTILLSFISFFNAILFFGPAIIVSITIDNLGYTMDKQTIIIKQAKIICIGLLGFFFGGYFSGIKFLGRLRTIMLGYILLIFFTLLALLFPKHFSWFYGFAYASIPIFYFGIPIYKSEFYPCRLRDLGVGYLYFINKIGGLGSQFIFIHLANVNVNLPFYAIIFICGLNIVFISLMPFETFNKGLDFMEKIE